MAHRPPGESVAILADMRSMPVPERFRARVAHLLRYGAVSVVATITGLAVLGALVTAGVSPGWANVIATAVGTIPSFELNRRWVWSVGGSPSVSRQVIPFVVVCFLELLGSTLAVHLAAGWASSHGWQGVQRTAVVEATNVVAFGSFWGAQYLLLDRVLFRRRSKSPERAEPRGPRTTVGGRT